MTEKQYWTAYVGDVEESVQMFDSEGEAAGEIECHIDANFEPGEAVIYHVAPMLSAYDILREDNAQWIGEDIFERINERVSDEMCADDASLELTPEDCAVLGKLVVDWLCEHAKCKWWTVANDKATPATYVAGSNDAGGT